MPKTCVSWIVDLITSIFSKLRKGKYTCYRSIARRSIVYFTRFGHHRIKIIDYTGLEDHYQKYYNSIKTISRRGDYKIKSDRTTRVCAYRDGRLYKERVFYK